MCYHETLTHAHTHSSEHYFFHKRIQIWFSWYRLQSVLDNSTVMFWGRPREKSLGACCLSLRYSKNCLLQPLSFPLFLAAAENVLMWRKPEVHSQRRDSGAGPRLIVNVWLNYLAERKHNPRRRRVEDLLVYILGGPVCLRECSILKDLYLNYQRCRVQAKPRGLFW